MSKRVWNNLEFTLINTNNNQKLHLGETSLLYPSIANSEEMFTALMGLGEEDEGREIPIALNLNSMLETSYLNNFLTINEKYNLEILANGLKYYTKCKVIKAKPERIDNLYGDYHKCITYNINLKLLDNNNFFETDPISSQSIGSVIDSHFRLGVSYPLEITKEMLDFPPIKSDEKILDKYEYTIQQYYTSIGNKAILEKISGEEYRLKAETMFDEEIPIYNEMINPLYPFIFIQIELDDNAFFTFENLSHFFDINFIVDKEGINYLSIDDLKEKSFRLTQDEISIKKIANFEEVNNKVNENPKDYLDDDGNIDIDKVMSIIEYEELEVSCNFIMMTNTGDNTKYDLRIYFIINDELLTNEYTYILLDSINIRNRYLRKSDTCICTQNQDALIYYTKKSFNYLKLVEDGTNLKIKSDCFSSRNNIYIIYNSIITNYFDFNEDITEISCEIISESGEVYTAGILKTIINSATDDERLQYILLIYNNNDNQVENDKIDISLKPQKNFNLIKEDVELSELYIISLYKPLEPVVIYNNGGDDIGFELTIKPNSPILNPVIYNITTGLSMTIFISVKATDTLIIDTRNKSVSLNGVYYENVKKIQDNWLKLQLGYNTVKFSAAEGGQDADIVLTFRKKVRGL